MTKKQTLLLEQSRVREAINALLGEAELTTEQRSEMETLTERAQEIEPELRAAIVSEPEVTITEAGDNEARELEELTGRASLAGIFSAAIEHRQTEGAEKELQAHFGLGASQVPVSMLEERAITPAPGNVEGNQSAIVPGVFPQSAAAFLSVDMPSVPTGDSVFPVLATNAAAGTPAEGAEQAETTGSFTATLLSPSRIQASFEFSLEDRSRLVGMSEALRMNLSDSLSDKLDQQILTGSKGLLSGSILADHNASAETSYAQYRSQFAFGRVDGTFAGSVSDIRSVVGSQTYGHAAGVFRSTNAGDRSALEDVMQATGGVRVSAHVPVVASKKQLSIVRLGSRRDMVAPIWSGISLIVDNVTKAKSGTIVITAVLLHAVELLRSGGFYKQQVQVTV